MDPNNLIWQGWKWRHGDVSRHTNGDLAAALGRIKAKTLVVPFAHDMFFPPEDCEAEQKLIPNSKYRVVQSLWAHFTMFCMTPSDREQIDACIADLLNEPAEIGVVDVGSVSATRRAPALRTEGPQPWAG
jgi:homoserine O-acetyltransferase